MRLANILTANTSACQSGVDDDGMLHGADGFPLKTQAENKTKQEAAAV